MCFSDEVSTSIITHQLNELKRERKSEKQKTMQSIGIGQWNLSDSAADTINRVNKFILCISCWVHTRNIRNSSVKREKRTEDKLQETTQKKINNEITEKKNEKKNHENTTACGAQTF